MSRYEREGSRRSHDKYKDAERDRERDKGRGDRESDRLRADRNRSKRDDGIRRSERDKDCSRMDNDDSPDRKRSRKEHRSSKSSRRETSAERAARKAERKAQKLADSSLLLPQEARLAAAEVSFYSAADNPFHDANLGDKFVWGKKREKERKQGLTPEEARQRDLQRQFESKQEIEKLNRRRAAREEEQKLREEEEMRNARLNESAQMAAWIDKEDDFHLEQAKRRAQIRVKEHRAKAIDFLALNLKWSQPALAPGEEGYDEDAEDEGFGLEIDMEEPYTIFENLTLEEVEELDGDIRMYLSLEKLPAHIEFWKSLLIVSSSFIESLQNERSMGHIAFEAQQFANAAIKAEIQTILEGKTYEQLVGLQKSIQRKLASGEHMDVEYWEDLLKELIVWKAKVRLRDMHEIVLSNRLEQLRKKQRDDAVQQTKEMRNTLRATHGDVAEAFEVAENANVSVEIVPEEWDEGLEPKKFTKIPEEYRQARLIDPEEELQILYAKRRQVASTRFVPRKTAIAPAAEEEPPKVEEFDTGGITIAVVSKDVDMVEGASVQGFDDDEDEDDYAIEVELAKSAYNWEDKYRPRKPRYYNKVHTGFEWNKYNQTHYDHDNPPPKVVQGYKFNIFYPDLIDKSKTPTFKVVKEPGNEDTCTLLFQAGPPYEDIAFTIVNKSWEYSHKRGFRSTFDKGVLQLYFQFKRDFYRS